MTETKAETKNDILYQTDKSKLCPDLLVPPSEARWIPVSGLEPNTHILCDEAIYQLRLAQMAGDAPDGVQGAKGVQGLEGWVSDDAGSCDGTGSEISRPRVVFGRRSDSPVSVISDGGERESGIESGEGPEQLREVVYTTSTVTEAKEKEGSEVVAEDTIVQISEKVVHLETASSAEPPEIGNESKLEVVQDQIADHELGPKQELAPEHEEHPKQARELKEEGQGQVTASADIDLDDLPEKAEEAPEAGNDMSRPNGNEVHGRTKQPERRGNDGPPLKRSRVEE